MTTQVQTTEANTTIIPMHAGMDIQGSDIIMPKIKLLQTNSDAVKEDKGRAGALIDMETFEELGYRSEKPLEIAILSARRFWLEKIGDEYSVRPALHKYELPHQEGNIERTYMHSFLVLLRKDMDAKGITFPYEISFSSTGLKTVSAISRQLLLMQGQGLPSYHRYFKLTSSLKKKGQHSWFSIEAAPGDKLSASDLKKAASIPSELLARPVAVEPHIEKMATTKGGF